jgi:hypothetical protein
MLKLAGTIYFHFTSQTVYSGPSFFLSMILPTCEPHLFGRIR